MFIVNVAIILSRWFQMSMSVKLEKTIAISTSNVSTCQALLSASAVTALQVSALGQLACVKIYSYI